MTTMRDVALAAKVSLKTVSRVVNAEPGVRPDTAARVQAVVDALDFRPNNVARSLRAGRSLPLIGLVIGDQANPFYSGIARGVEEVARRHRYLVITGSSDDQQVREQQLVTSLRQQQVAGLLLVPARDHAHRPLDLGGRLPVVFVDRPPHSGEGDAVVLDNRGGARQGVELLIRLGHRRIGLVCDGLPYFTIDERIAGYREALQGAGIPVDPALLVRGARDVTQATAAGRHLLSLDDPPTALFALNNRTCVGVLRAVSGGRHEVSVLGFDGLELADLLSIPLILITHDPLELGRCAARLLFARLNGDRGPHRRMVLPTTLVSYGGCGRSQSAP